MTAIHNHNFSTNSLQSKSRKKRSCLNHAEFLALSSKAIEMETHGRSSDLLRLSMSSHHSDCMFATSETVTKEFRKLPKELTAAGLFRTFTGFPFHHLSKRSGEPMRHKDTFFLPIGRKKIHAKLLIYLFFLQEVIAVLLHKPHDFRYDCDPRL